MREAGLASKFAICHNVDGKRDALGSGGKNAPLQPESLLKKYDKVTENQYALRFDEVTKNQLYLGFAHHSKYPIAYMLNWMCFA